MFDEKIKKTFKNYLNKNNLIYEKIGFTRVARTINDLVKILKFYEKNGFLTKFDPKLFRKNRVLLIKFKKQLDILLK